MIIAQISVTAYGVAHIMVLSAVRQINKLSTSILWHISKVTEQLNLTQLSYILQFELKVCGNKY
jgi:hypothetical protein